MIDSANEPVQVFVRIRPEPLCDNSPTKRHAVAVDKCVHVIDDTTVRFSPPDSVYGSRKGVPAVDDKIYTFDNVLDEQATQDMVYELVRNNVKATVKGYNTTIFAYGSTGSGKSYTMTGTTSQPGIIPRAISEVFSFIEASAALENDVYFYVRISYVELYNNNFRNLLDFASKELALKDKEDERDNFGHGLKGKHKIEVRESQTAGVFLAGPNLRIPVTTAQEAFQLISRGNKSRAVGATQCNDVSSRSHAILTVHVESRLAAKDGGVSELRLGKMHLVDLAGSERVSMSGAEGDTLTETQSINLSLSAIGDVLSALSRNATVLSQQPPPNTSRSKSPMSKSQTWSTTGGGTLVPVPYRNSKLTHLLKDSLGGNSKTIMITTIRSTPEYCQLTAASLMYSSRAKKIKNRSLVNHDVIGDTGIYKVTNEIERLRSRLEERTKEFERLRALHLQDTKENSVLKSRLQELQLANESEKQELEAQMSQVIHSQEGELALQKDRINGLQTALEQELSESRNLIAEQEKEIKWLQQALDESGKTSGGQGGMHGDGGVIPEEVDELKRELHRWRLAATSAQEDLMMAQHRSKELGIANAALTGRVAELSGQVEDVSQMREDLAASLAQTSEELSYYRMNKDSLDAKCTALEDKLRLSIHESTQRDASYKEVVAKLAASESVVSSLVESTRNKEADLVRENVRLKELLEQSVSSLEKDTVSVVDSAAKKVTAAEAFKSMLEQDNLSLKASLAAAIEELSTLKGRQETEASKLQSEIAALSSTSALMRSQLAAQRDSNAGLKKANDALKAELSARSTDLVSKSGSYASDLERRVLEVQALKKTHTEELEHEREKYREQVEATQARYAGEIEKLQLEVDEVLLRERSANKSLQTQLEQLREEQHQQRVEAAASNDDDGKANELLLQRTYYDDLLAKAKADGEAVTEEALSTQRIKYKLLMKEKLVQFQKEQDEAFEAQLREVHATYARELQSALEQNEAVRVSKDAEIQQVHEAFTGEVEQLRHAEEKQRRQLDEALDSQAMEWSSRLEHVKTEAAESERRLQLLQAQVKTQYNQVALSRSSSSDMQQLLGASSDLTGEEKDAETILQEIDEAHTRKVRSLRALVESKEQSLSELELRLTHELTSRGLTELELEQTQQRLAELAAEMDALRAVEAERSAEEFAALEDSHIMLEDRVAELEVDVSDWADKYRAEVDERAASELKTGQLLREKERESQHKLEAALSEKEELYRETMESVHKSYQKTMKTLEGRLQAAEQHSHKAIAELDDQAKQQQSLKFEALLAESQHSVTLAEARMRDEHNLQLSRVISSHKLEIDMLWAELEGTKTKLHEASEEYQGLATVLVDMEASFESRLAEETRELTEEISSLEAELNERNESSDIIKANLHNVTEKYIQVEELLTLAIRDKEEVQRSSQEALEGLSEEKSNLRSQLRLHEETVLHLQDVAGDQDEGMRVLKSLLEEEHTRAEQLEQRWAATLREIKQEHEERLGEVQSSREQNTAQVRDENIELANKVRTLEDKLDKIVSEVTMEQENALLEMQGEFEGREEQLRASHKLAMADLQATYEAQLEEELAQREAEEEAALENLSAQADARENAMRIQHDEQVAEVEAQYAATISTLTRQIKSLQDTQQKQEEELDRFGAWESERRQLVARLNRATEDYASAVREVEELSAARTAERERLTDAHRRAMQTVQEEWNSKLLLSEQEHVSRLDHVHSQLRQVETRHKERVERLEASLQEHLSSRDELQTAVGDKEVAILDLKRQVEKIKRDSESVIFDQKVMADGERKRLDSQYRSEITSLIETNSRLQDSLEGSSGRVQALEAELQAVQSELDAVLVEKRVLDDIYTRLIDTGSSSRQPSDGVLQDLKSSLQRTVKESVLASGGSHKSRPQLSGNSRLGSSMASSIDSSSDIGFSSHLRSNHVPQLETTSRSLSEASLHSRRSGVGSGSPAGSPKQHRSPRSSPTELLIAAIVDGDSQSLLSIVRAQGKDFKSGYWQEVAASIMPLHRAVSGLHFHGSEKLLISTLSVLIQLGANINAADYTGSTVLHRVLHICTSKSVCSLLELLLVQGADPNIQNNDGETPLHFECKRTRSASADIIKLLLNSGAKPNKRVYIPGATSNNGPTALTLLLNSFGLKGESSNGGSGNPGQTETGAGTNKKLWLRSLEQLLKGGAKWEPSLVFSNGKCQLTLLYEFFPPASSDVHAYIRIVGDAIDAGFDLNKEDANGRISLFALCERLAETSILECPDAPLIIRSLVTYYTRKGFGAADRRGTSLLDIADRVDKSCLSFCRKDLSDAILKSPSPSAIKNI